MAASVLAFSGAEAKAAIVHEFLPAPSQQLDKGIPAGCGAPSPACVSGPFGENVSLTVDTGQLWVADSLLRNGFERISRVDKFNDAGGEFSPPQLDEERGVLDQGVAVGHAGGEEQVYVGGGIERHNALAVFGPSGKLQPEGVWLGTATPQGSFEAIRGVAVSSNLGPTLGDVYVSQAGHVDIFPGEKGGKEPAKPIGQLELTGAAGSGTLTKKKRLSTDPEHIPSWTIEAITTNTGRFGRGQEIRGAGIPPGTKITALGCDQGTGSEPPGSEPCIEISKEPTSAGPVSLTAIDKVGAVAVSSVTGDVVVAAGSSESCGSGTADCVIDVLEPSTLPGTYTRLVSIKGPPGEPFRRIGAVAVDGQGDIYVVEEAANVVDQFDSTGKFRGPITHTPQGPFKKVTGVAVDPATGDVYVGDYDQEHQVGVVDVFGPTRIVPDVATTTGEAVVNAGAGGEGAIEATLEGIVDPLGQGPASCGFAFGTTAAFGTFAACDEAIAQGEGAVPVRASVKAGLLPGTRYVFRLQASNKNGTNPGEEADNKELLTPGPGIRDESAADVSSTAARLRATLDPNGAPTSYYFEYGKSSVYEAQAPAAPGLALGEATGDVKVPPQAVQGLAPETLYHYRVVAVSQLHVNGGGVQAVWFAGPDKTFTTQGAGAQALPDSRHWELVSPPDKHGAELEGNGGGAVAAAAAGGSVSYQATSPPEANVQGTKGQDEILSTRTTSGWSSQDLSLGRAEPVSIVLGGEYSFLSSSLSDALVEPPGEEFSSLAPEVFPPDTERGPYIRHNSTCTETPATCFQPLLVGCPPPGEPCPAAIAEHADIPPGTKFGGNPTTPGQDSYGAARVIFATPDLRHMVVEPNVALSETPTGEKSELYEVSPASPPAQELRLVSIIPSASGEVPAPGGPSLGARAENMRHAVSDDGSRVVFSSESHLYMRDLARERTVQLDAPQSECLLEATCGDGEVGSRFQLAASDGSRVLFTDLQRLTKGSGRTPGKADLYQCDMREVEGALRCEITDLTPAPGPGRTADVLGAVIGASEDASWVYFAANGVLGDAAAHGATPGDCKITASQPEGAGCHLYSYHEGVTHLVATVGGGDFASWTGRQGSLDTLTARVSPDGRFLSFMSQASLTGYDNRDAVSGEADQEVFLYHAEGSAVGALACVSCNPSGARPSGAEAAKLSTNVGTQGWFPDTWIASSVPGWTPYAPGRAVYQTRYLSDSGRLFFNSHDALAPLDINGTEDVYQFEPVGVGDCSSASATFHAVEGGCVALISSGTAAGESAFVDASESGNDVFFLTGERLVGKDVDAAVDLYDAHVCSAGSPCPEEVVAAASCVTADSCRAAPAGQPGIFGAPSSATFAGIGNLSPAPSAVVRASKPLSRAQKLARALKACHRIHRKRSRKSCERRAHKRYGPSRRARKASSRGASVGVGR
ncbi:MAG TPA: hypothetical protein VGO29_09915 [Solirubrobacteraceae bacterium]|jgi:hypothetical protein|nr:hypothetical protein [Solirubrobacteraceae bacterium]